MLAVDHAIARRALSGLLEYEEGVELVAVVVDLEALLSGLRTYRPDVVVVDLRVPRRVLTEDVRAVRQRSPTTGVVIVTMHVARSFAESVLDAGTLGVVLKDTAERDLGEAVRLAACGQRYTSESFI